MSAKVLDPKGRFRGKIVSFRCSEEENAALDVAVQLSGLTKQDYIISRVLQRDIVVQPNPRVYKALKDRLELVLAELKKSEEAATNSDLLETINLIAVTLNGIKGGNTILRAIVEQRRAERAEKAANHQPHNLALDVAMAALDLLNSISRRDMDRLICRFTKTKRQIHGA